MTVKDSKMTAWVVEPTEGAGWMAILKPLEVEVPAAWRLRMRCIERTGEH